MEDYRINKIYTNPEDMYAWQGKIKDHVNTDESDGVTILAPEGYGKTYFCRDMINEWLEMLAPGANILYYSPKHDACDRMAVTCAFIQQGHMTRDYTITNDDQQTIVIPATAQQLKDVLSSAMRFDLIIIDDADIMGNAALHSIILKGMLDDAKLVIVGTSHENEEIQLSKSIWKWLLNHPCYTAFEVVKPSLLPQEEEAGKTMIDHLISILHPMKYHYVA